MTENTINVNEANKLIPEKEIKGRSLWQDAWMRLKRNRAAVFCSFTLFIIMILSIIIPEYGPNDYTFQDYNNIATAPTWDNFYIFGTDPVGRDMFTRVFYGIRVSLIVGFVASITSLFIGVIYGATAGFIGGKTDTVMMRIVDMIYSLPFMFLFILTMVLFREHINEYFDSKIYILVLIIGLVEWLDMARIVRGQTLSVKQKEFIEAAHASGVRKRSVLFRHIIPNCIGPVVIYVTLLIPRVILVESFLSFLGLGIDEPQTSLGKLIDIGVKNDLEAWLLIFPTFFLALILFCFNYIGDGLRDALDPKDR